MRDGHMVKKKRIKSQKGKENGREGEKRERKGKKNSFVSKIYGNPIVGFHRSKRQSCSTHRKLRVGTKILEFC